MTPQTETIDKVLLPLVVGTFGLAVIFLILAFIVRTTIAIQESKNRRRDITEWGIMALAIAAIPVAAYWLGHFLIPMFR